MNLELVGALNELEKERGISKEILFEAIEAAIVSAYKRNYGNTLNVRVDLNDRSGEIRVFARKDVVDEVLDEPNEISLEEAKKINPNYDLDDIVEIEVTPRDFGRIAAQTAKQVVIQRIREAERALIHEEFSNRVEDIVTGIVQRQERRNILIDLGKVEAILPQSEQAPQDDYSPNTRLKVYVSEVRNTTKGPQVFVSRSHPGLLKRLFELEVPEIHDGLVEIKGVSREAGNRAKIAVYARDRNIDPVGACVGPRGLRVQTVVQELRGEKIDIVAWDPMPDQYIANALSPAKVVRVVINADEKSARAIVPDHQLSLAIGKEGQNARLAARLTGWKIDIKSESQMKELIALEALRPKDDLFLSDDAAEEEMPHEEREITNDDVVIEQPAADEDVLIEHAEDVVADSEDDFEEEYTEVEDPLFESVDIDGGVEDVEEDEEPEKTPSKPKRRLTEEREEDLDDLLEEVQSLEEDDDLPSLFSDDEEELDSIPTPGAPTPAPVLDTKVSRSSTKKDEETPKDKGGKTVLKDLADLAKLIETDEEDDVKD